VFLHLLYFELFFERINKKRNGDVQIQKNLMSAALLLGMPAAAGQTDEMHRFHSKDDKSVGLSARSASFAQSSKWREKG
jgi:hypothetical protein